MFDIRQFSLLQCLQLHSSAINCIAMNDIDGYFVTGAVDGEIKVCRHGMIPKNLNSTFPIKPIYILCTSPRTGDTYCYV